MSESLRRQSNADPYNLHRVVVEFDDGVYAVRLIHPEDGCQPTTTCGECYTDLRDPDAERCPYCDGMGQDECWVTGWFENLTPDELLRGRVELIVQPEWNHETCTLHVVEARAPATEGHE